MISSKQILYVGSLSVGQTSFERFKSLVDLGHEVEGINMMRDSNKVTQLVFRILNYFGIIIDFIGLNNDIKSKIDKQDFDLVWVDKGVLVYPSTLRYIRVKRPKCKLLHLNPDDPFGKFRKGWYHFLRGIKLYHIHFVARQQNIEEYKSRGAFNVHVYDRSFSLTLHKPIELSAVDKNIYGAKVGFIGSYAPERAETIAFLLKNGIDIAVYGNGWENKPTWNVIKPHFRSKALFGENYVKAINGMNIALHFLRKENRDEQDSRTFELPACGVFMIAERTSKHEDFFVENQEAVFFDTEIELLEKLRFFLNNPIDVAKIASSGRLRCLNSGYDHQSRMKGIMEKAFYE